MLGKSLGMDIKIKELSKLLKEAVPNTAKKWNEEKLSQFTIFFESPFRDFFKDISPGQKTQSITKICSPILNKMLVNEIGKTTSNFIEYETDGCDFKFYDIKIEGKITTSNGNSWTGNGYAKTPIHILIRFLFEESGKIHSIFSMIVDLNKTRADWTDPTTSNFSTLKFYVEDKNRLIICNGGAKLKTKYLHWEMQKI